ncbi:cyclic nucleotide-binding domain-containing protein [Listeria kieliensis]
MKERNKIFVLKKGRLLIQFYNQKGEYINAQVVNEGCIINIDGLIENFPSQNLAEFIRYKAVSLEYSEIIELEKEFFLSHLYVDPRAYHALFEKIITDLFTIYFAYLISNEKTTYKVSWALLRLAETFSAQAKKQDIVRLPKYVNQKFISQFAQTGLARTSEAMAELYEKDAILLENRRITVDRKRILACFNSGSIKLPAFAL